MSIPESQLEVWSKQGANVMSKNTYGSIKNCLEQAGSAFSGKEFNVYLQGSYGNDTNIRADSDVDIAIQLNSTFHHNLGKLPSEQVQAFKASYPDATYRFPDFKSDVLSHLQKQYGVGQVKLGRKSVNISASSGRLEADVVVSCQYREYDWFKDLKDQNYEEGIALFSTDGKMIINYPKQHSRNCTSKHQATGNRFKPLVRVLKNMRSRLEDDGSIGRDVAPSYFIEGLLFNVPENEITGDLTESFVNSINWIYHADRTKFVCPNRMQYLFGDSSTQWDIEKCTLFLGAVTELWKSW